MSLQALTKRFSLRREKPARARKTKSDDPPAYTVKKPSNLSLWRQANKSALSYKQFSDHFHKYTQGTLLPCEAREMDVRVIEGVLRMTECGTVKTKSEMLNFNFHIDPFGRCPEQSSKTQLTVYLLWVYTDNETDTAAHGKWLKEIREKDSESLIIIVRCHIDEYSEKWRAGRGKDHSKELDSECLKLATMYLDGNPHNRRDGPLWKAITRCAILQVIEETDFDDFGMNHHQKACVTAYKYKGFEPFTDPPTDLEALARDRSARGEE